jgi:ankyrin repeat protein
MSDKRVGSSSTGLCEAVASGDLQRVELLLEQGVNPRTRCTYETLIDRSNVEGSRSAFFFALQEGNEALANLLLCHGADPDDADGLLGHTPLTYAAYHGLDEMLRNLVGAGASVDLVNPFKRSPLEVAIYYGREAIALALLEAGAKPDAAALAAACAHNQTRLATRLLDAGAQLEARTLESAARGGPGTLEWVSKQDAGPHLVARHGAAALEAAALAGNAASVSWLLRNGVPPDARNGYGWTPLQTAACAGSAEAVQVLLDAGADPAAVEGTGKTAAEWARERRHVAIAEKLEALAPPAPAKPSTKTKGPTKRRRAK